MKKLFLLLLLTTGISANAYEYPYLAFKTTDGTVKTVSVESLSLTISDGKLVAVYDGGSTEFTLTDLSEMYFSEKGGETTGIGQVETENSTVQVYSLTGVSMGTFESVSQARSILKNGVYVMKTNNKSIKITIKK